MHKLILTLYSLLVGSLAIAQEFNVPSKFNRNDNAYVDLGVKLSDGRLQGLDIYRTVMSNADESIIILAKYNKQSEYEYLKTDVTRFPFYKWYVKRCCYGYSHEFAAKPVSLIAPDSFKYDNELFSYDPKTARKKFNSDAATRIKLSEDIITLLSDGRVDSIEFFETHPLNNIIKKGTIIYNYFIFKEGIGTYSFVFIISAEKAGTTKKLDKLLGEIIR